MTTTAKAGKWDRPYDLVVTRRRRLLGFGGLDERIMVGLWTDQCGRKRRTELCGLGTAYTVDTAMKLAESGMAQHAEGTAIHRRYHDWHQRLRATERCMARAEDAYWAKVRAYSGDVPEYRSPALSIAAE